MRVTCNKLVRMVHHLTFNLHGALMTTVKMVCLPCKPDQFSTEEMDELMRCTLLPIYLYLTYIFNNVLLCLNTHVCWLVK